MKLIDPASGTGFILKKNQTLHVFDMEGLQVSDLFCVSLENHSEVLSCARSMDYVDKIYLSAGDVLYSNRSSRMLKIIKDTCGRHDLLMPPCSLKMFQIVANDESLLRPSCHGNLAKNLEPFGIKPDEIQNSFNIFMNVNVSPSGGVQIEAPLSRAMDHISFLAEMDLIVGLTACAHEQTNAGRLKQIGYLIEG